MAIGVIVVVQIAQFSANNASSGHEGASSYKELLNVLFRIIAGFKQSTHAIYQLKMLSQEVKDNGSWREIGQGHLDSQKLVAAVEVVMKEESNQTLTEQQRMNLHSVLSEHLRLSETLKSILHSAPEFD